MVAINRGERRVFQSLVIDIEGEEAETFPVFTSDSLLDLDRSVAIDNLVNSGHWVALRTRPFSKVPSADSIPSSIFVTAMDTNPLATDPTVVIAERADDFANGLKVLTRLTEGPVNVCAAPNVSIPGNEIEGCVRLILVAHIPPV